VREAFFARRRSAPLIGGIVVIVLVWWGAIFPHTSWYQRQRNESLVEKRLKKIQAPRTAKLVKFGTTHRQGWPEATADYFIDSDCASLKRYYKDEFAGQGFTSGYEYKGLQSAPEADSLFYSDHDYSVGLMCDSTEKQPRSYRIIVVLDPRTNKESPLPNPMDGTSR
jgi:hypothetical protein